MARIITFFLFSFVALILHGQDECSSAIFLSETRGWCSEIEAYDNFAASASLLGDPTCFSDQGFDVWFSFRAIASDVNITILGQTLNGNFGTLQSPEAVLYSGSCDGFLSENDCESNVAGNGVVELYRGGLIAGGTYFIRVRGRNSVRGTFQICINNYNPPADPSSDCVTGAILCDKSSFTVASVTGAGNDVSELDDATCFGAFGGNNESNSTWFKWRAKNTGNFVFTLTPGNPVDDLDFVLYELPNGLNDCRGKRVLRCMAAGEFENLYPSPCHGPTGLNFVETDISENAGCSEGQNSFLKFVILEEGKSYALAVNNFTTFGNGFNISFGGTAEFMGPEVEIVTDAEEICIGDEINVFGIVSDEISNISGIGWTFGEDVSPETGTGEGPFVLNYETAGEKYISIVVENTLGCRITKTQKVTVNDFPEFSPVVSNSDCYNSHSGTVEIMTAVSPDLINWSTGESGYRISNLSPGIYYVTIDDDSGCSVIDTFEISEPAPPGINVSMSAANCGGNDGSLGITVTGFFEPYEIDWNDGNGFGTVFIRQNLPSGFYPVSFRDDNGCIFDTTLTVSEYVLELDVDIDIQKNPSCIGFSDGEISLHILNNEGPYEIDWLGEGDFVQETTLQNLAAGEYRITVRDAIGCHAYIVVNLVDPPALQLNISRVNPTCFDSNDGSISVAVMNGTGPFSYNWSVGGLTREKLNIRAGTYLLTITDGNNCTNEFHINLRSPDSIRVNEITISDVLCFGESTGLIKVEGEGGSAPYRYSIDGVNFANSGEFTDLKAGMYVIRISDSKGCLAVRTFEISEPDFPLIVDAGTDRIINLGDETTLISLYSPFGKLVSYSWSPVDSIDCITCDKVTVDPTATTVYYLTITDEDGCTSTDSVTVFVEKNRKVYIPNIFTPNTDGNNDFFTAFTDQEARGIHLMRIYNRWGALIFEKRDFRPNIEFEGWDGTFKGSKVGQGTYVYVIHILFKDNEIIEYSGDINVIW